MHNLHFHRDAKFKRRVTKSGLPMKLTPSLFQSLFRALAFLAVAVMLWPLWWVILTYLVELSWVVFVPIFLVLCAYFVRRFVRQLDAVEGPCPRSTASDTSEVDG